MNDYNLTDSEQIAMIKKWWKDYGRAIAVAVAIGLIVGFGWRYWSQHKVERAQQASVLYQQLSVADFQKQPKVAMVFANKLKQEYSHSPYASYAAFWAAKKAVNNKNLPLALKNCRWVVTNGRVKSLKQIARIRAARILLAQKKLKAAMTMLDRVNDKTFMPLINNVKGDIYTAMGEHKAARKAFESAKAGMSASIGVVDPLLDMKLAQ